MADAGKLMEIRAEAWRTPRGGRHALLVARSGGECICILVQMAHAGAPWMQGLGAFPPDAFMSPRSAFAERLAMGPACGGLLFAMGLLDGTPENLAGMLLAPWEPMTERAVDGATIIERGRVMRHISKAWTDMSLGGGEGWRDRLRLIGYQQPRRWQCVPGMLVSRGELPMPRGGRAPSRPPATFTIEHDDNHDFSKLPTVPPMPGEDQGTLAGLVAYLGAWCIKVLPWLAPPKCRFLRRPAWSGDLLAHYAAPGPLGTYRRQAAELYPFLIPAFVHEPALRALVDAGSPFEVHACRVLNEAMGQSGPNGITPAKLRRLRGLPYLNQPGFLGLTLGISGRLGLRDIERLRGDGPGFQARLLGMQMVLHWAAALGLDVPTLLRRVPCALPDTTVLLRHASDLVTRFAETVVVPALGGRAYASRERLAGMALFQGRDMETVADVSKLWHARLGRFEASLPQGRDLSTWPALFEPFERGGVRIACLTKPSQLRAEGGAGPDHDGREGLDHCVGGYGSRCYSGESHIASVTVDGGARRVSTLEISHQGGGFIARQHQARSNTTPPDEAARAVEVLMRGLANGSVRTDPAALARRDPDGYRDGVAWEGRAESEAAWAAWRPYLPKAMARMGLDGFRAWLSSEAEASERSAAA